MHLCDICRKNISIDSFKSLKPDRIYHSYLPRVRSEEFYFCENCFTFIEGDQDKYTACDLKTRIALSRHNPVPRRTRLIYRELSFHRNIDKIITEYSL